MSGFKLLVGAAAIAVLAFVGYFFVRQYKDTQRAEAAAKLYVTRKGCLESRSGKTPALRDWCIKEGYIKD